jgi:hypothetical protein
MSDRRRRTARETARARLGPPARSHLRELGLERRAVDSVFRSVPNVLLPGYTRPLVRVEDYLELIDQHTFREDRVWPPLRSLASWR